MAQAPLSPRLAACYNFAVTRIIGVLCFSFLAATGICAGAATFHVSTTGSDTNPGTKRKPFASLVRARDDIRKLRQAGRLREPVTIVVHGGTYVHQTTLELGVGDSGTARRPITWQAAPGEEVRLSGGPTFPAAAFRRVTNEKTLARLDAAARTHVVELDLRSFTTTIVEFPITFRGVPEAPELFFNDQRMTLARWPNQGWATISKIIDSGSVPRYGDDSGRPGVFEYSDDRPQRWNVAAGVWLQGYWCYDWYDETIQVKSIAPGERRMTLAAPALYGLNHGNPSPRRFRALNLLEELDEPGEFYIDQAAGALYFWPPSPLDGARVALSTLNAPLLLLNNTEHVTFRGFVVEASLGNGIEVSGGRSNRIESCVVRNTRQLGIRVTGGEGHVVESCDIHDTGTGGLVLEGGDRKTLAPARHQALNNHIWQFSRHQMTAAYGLVLGGVGNRAAHNVFHDTPHQAILLAGNDHLFEFNVISNVVMETDDAGALYKGRNPSCRGNIIRYNFWRDIGSPMGHGTAAIYFDDGDGGDLVFGNIFLRCGHPGGGSFGTIFSHGGHDSRAENNVFIDCRRPLGSVPWSDPLWKETIEGGHGCDWQTRLLKEVDITKPPYTTRYPELVGFMNPQPGQPRNNRAKNNLLFGCGEASSGNWKFSGDEMFATNTRPVVNETPDGRLALQLDAEVFKRLPGFKPIPVQQIGFAGRRAPRR